MTRSPFVPPPLPPDLSYGREVVAAVVEAERCLGELAGLGRQLPNPHLLIRPFLKKEAALSSQIEGTQAGVADLYASAAGQAVPPGFLKKSADPDDIREVENYVEAFEHGLERLETLPVSLRLLKELHRILMRGVRGAGRAPGEFRRIQNWIGPEGCKLEEATYVPPPPREMENALSDFERYIHLEAPLADPPVVRLAFLHYQFEAIHPFLDGNGRIGRLLLALLLVHWRLLPQPLLYLSAYFERRRSDYYRLLLDVSEKGAWLEWVLFFAEGVRVQSREAIELARALQDLQRQWRDLVSQKGASSHLPKAVDLLLEAPILTIPQLAKRLEISYPPAKKHVETLKRLGILEETPRSTGPRVFFSRQILNLVG